MHTWVTVMAKSSARWQELMPQIEWALSELTSLQCPPGEPLPDFVEQRGIRWKMKDDVANRVDTALFMSGIGEDLVVERVLIPLEDDTDEQEIQGKLYPAGNTSKKPREIRERVLPSKARQKGMDN